MPLPVPSTSIVIVAVRIIGDRTPEIKNPTINHSELGIIAWCNIDRGEPILDSIEIDFHHYWFLGLFLFAIAIFLFLRFFGVAALLLLCLLVTGLFLVGVLVFILFLTHFIAAWTKRS